MTAQWNCQLALIRTLVLSHNYHIKLLFPENMTCKKQIFSYEYPNTPDRSAKAAPAPADPCLHMQFTCYANIFTCYTAFDRKKKMLLGLPKKLKNEHSMLATIQDKQSKYIRSVMLRNLCFEQAHVMQENVKHWNLTISVFLWL